MSFQLDAPHYVSLIIALNRATLTPFTRSDWDGWSGAEGKAHMIEFRESDLVFLMKRLGILHWTKEGVVVILDDHGISFNGMHPKGYAACVEIKLSIGNYDPGTELEPWYHPEETLEVDTGPQAMARLGQKLLTAPSGAFFEDRDSVEEVIAHAAEEAGLTPVPEISDLDAQLRAAVSRTADETGVIPGEPGIAPRDGLAPATGHQPSAAPAEQALDAVDGSQNTVAPGPALPANARPMEEAPKGAGAVLLLTSPDEAVIAKWNDSFGRQFWVGLDGESLGFDDSYLGWVPDTESNRTQFGLDDE